VSLGGNDDVACSCRQYGRGTVNVIMQGCRSYIIKNIYEVSMQTITQYTLTDQMDYQGTPVLNCQIRYPRFDTACGQDAQWQVNEFYRSMSEEKGAYCRSSLYPEAVSGLEYSRAGNFPFFPYEFDVGYNVTFNEECFASLYFDQYEFTGGAHGSTIRTSQTWDLETGRQLTLGDFYPDDPDYIKEIQEWIEYEIAGRLKAGPSTYFDDYPELLRSTFQAGNFYLTPEGIVIYYQQYDIAPYSSGITEFLLPFSGTDS